MKSCTAPIKSFLLVLSLTLGQSACSSKGLDAPERLGPITSEEAEAFAARLIEAAISCQHAKLREVIDINAGLRRALRASTLNGRLQREYFAELSRYSPKILTGFFECDERDTDPQMAVARYSERDGRTRILVGFSHESITYLEFAVGKSNRGQVIADDVYSIVDEQLFSERIRDYINMVAGDSRRTAELVETIQLLESSPAEGLERVSRSSSTSQETKHMRTGVLQALAVHDPKGYQSASAKFREDFPEHPPMLMLDFESQITAGDGEGATRSLDALENKLGTLPFLDELRLRVCFESQTYCERALASSREMVEANPEQLTAHMNLMSAQIMVEDDGEALATMRHIGQHFDLIWGPETAEEELFARFSQTPEWEAYQEWRAAYEAQFADEDAATVVDEPAITPPGDPLQDANLQ